MDQSHTIHCAVIKLIMRNSTCTMPVKMELFLCNRVTIEITEPFSFLEVSFTLDSIL